MVDKNLAVKEVQAAMEKWARALKDKDLEAMHKDHAASYRIFDVGSTADGVEAVKNLWAQCFPYFDRPEIHYKKHGG